MHQNAVEPASKLESHILERADQPESTRTVQLNRAKICRISDHGNHLPKLASRGLLDQPLKQHATDPAPLRLRRSEEALSGGILDDAAIAAAADAASGPSRPMDNTDFSFLWRKEMTRRYVADALRDLRGDVSPGRRPAPRPRHLPRSSGVS